MTFIIRRFQQSDQDSIMKLHIEGLNQFQASVANPLLDQDLQQIDESYIQNGGEFLVGTIGNEIISMGAYRKYDDQTAEIKWLRIDVDYQRTGYGQRMLTALETSARAKAYTKLRLDTTTRQLPAQKLFEKNGYKETHRKNYMDMELIFYSKEINPMYKFTQMTESYAKLISTWTYPSPYDLYNMDGNDETVSELMDGDYFYVEDKTSRLIGFVCCGNSARVPGGYAIGIYQDDDIMDIGLGLCPDLTGQGLGSEFLKQTILFMDRRFGSSKYQLVVAAFNERAIKVYEKVGFEQGKTFFSTVSGKQIPFIVMKLMRKTDEGEYMMAEIIVREDHNVTGLPLPNRTRLVITDELPRIETTTCAFVLAFENDKLLLTNLRDRGWDIPGGHIEPSETYEEAAIRELYEETGVQIEQLNYLGYEEISLFGAKPDGYKYPFPNSYMVFYCATIASYSTYDANAESIGRDLFNPEQARRIKWIQENRMLYVEALKRTRVNGGIS